MRIFGKDLHISFGKIFLWLIGLLFLALVVWFFSRIGVYYWAIRSGESNPLLNQKLQMTVGKAIANTTIDPEYAKRLIVADAPSIGPVNAPLTIVEFLDFDCPFCKAAFPSVRELQARFGTQVRLVIRHFPLQELHPTAEIAARAAACAHKTGHFWVYHDKLFANQDARTEEALLRFAVESGMDGNQFKKCLQSDEIRQLVQRDFDDGIRAGAVGTPTFFFNGTRIPGWGESEVMAYLIETWLKQLSTQTTKTP
ncbi:thioredoxin domain-containing protein [Patescibacteria group bacterium]|nr:thioredoxin domain-containing protein [Patescibacteria group bacterium]